MYRRTGYGFLNKVYNICIKNKKFILFDCLKQRSEPNLLPTFLPKVPKYGVENWRNTDTAFMISYTYWKMYPSSVFVFLKHACTSNQPQPSRQNVRRPRLLELRGTAIEKYGHWMPYQFHHRNCVIIQSKFKNKKNYRPAMDRRAQMNSTTVPRRIFFYRIPLAKRLKNRVPQG